MIDVTVEQISDSVSVGVQHGWHASRLVKQDGKLYAIAPIPGADAQTGPPYCRVFQREADGTWSIATELDVTTYTTCIGPKGEFWMMGSYDFNNCHIWKSAPHEPNATEHVYQGRCFYGGTGMDQAGNFLFLHAERTDQHYGVPNAQIAAFYDVETDSWHTSRFPTPEGRYGYVHVLVRGRSAVALIQSTIYDFRANPVGMPIHYNWRYVRVVRCDDLTKGEWTQEPWLMPRYGRTCISDATESPDGLYRVLVRHQGGNESFEATQLEPDDFMLATLAQDKPVESVTLDMDVKAARLFFSTDGRWFMTGRPVEGGDFHLWQLDPTDYSVLNEWDLPGTAVLGGDIVRTLRPDRWGGEADGDTIHLMSGAGSMADAEEDRLAMWHVQFDLPAAE
jgi:hypothetical protein